MKLITGLVLSIAAISLHAELVRVSYSGTVSSLTYADCTSLVNGSCDAWTFAAISSTNFLPGQHISVGEGFSGAFVYDSSASATMSDDGYQAVYLDSVPIAQFQASSFGLPTVSLPMSPYNGSFSVVDGRSGTDIFQVSANYTNLDYFSNMYLSMLDSTGTAITGFAAPTSLSISQFGYTAIQIGTLRRVDGDQVQLAGSINAISFTPAVPEPETALLMALGAMVLALSAKRRADGSGAA